MSSEKKSLEIVQKQLDEFEKYGSLLPSADWISWYLEANLTGKQDVYLVDKDGNRVEEGQQKVPGVYSFGVDSKSAKNPFAECVYGIELHWDQWARCRILCNHGEFEEVSDFLNPTEAVMRAIVAFNDADHPEGGQG